MTKTEELIQNKTPVTLFLSGLAAGQNNEIRGTLFADDAVGLLIQDQNGIEWIVPKTSISAIKIDPAGIRPTPQPMTGGRRT